MLSLVWAMNELAKNQNEYAGRRKSMLGGSIHTVVLALNLLCLALDEKHNLGAKANILEACR
jgi:hypothetical protein